MSKQPNGNEHFRLLGRLLGDLRGERGLVRALSLPAVFLAIVAALGLLFVSLGNDRNVQNAYAVGSLSNVQFAGSSVTGTWANGNGGPCANNGPRWSLGINWDTTDANDSGVDPTDPAAQEELFTLPCDSNDDSLPANGGAFSSSWGGTVVNPCVTLYHAPQSNVQGNDVAATTCTTQATSTPTPTDTPTATPTNTPTDTPTPTNTPTNTPTSTPTGTPTNTPTSTPTGTPTNTPTSTPTNTPTSTPTGTPTNTPTSTPTGTPTNTPTSTPTGTPTTVNSQVLGVIVTPTPRPQATTAPTLVNEIESVRSLPNTGNGGYLSSGGSSFPWVLVVGASTFFLVILAAALGRRRKGER
jgi:hypothetical protein